jgi:hypothetical protein
MVAHSPVHNIEGNALGHEGLMLPLLIHPRTSATMTHMSGGKRLSDLRGRMIFLEGTFEDHRLECKHKTPLDISRLEYVCARLWITLGSGVRAKKVIFSEKEVLVNCS